MNARQSNKFDAYRAVRAVLQEAPEVRGIPALPEKVAQFNARIDEIDALGRRQSEPTSAATLGYHQLLDEMVELAQQVAGAVTVLAREQNQPHLAITVRVTPREFARARTINRPLLAGRILDAAQPLALQLLRFGITPEVLARLGSLIHATQGGAQQRLAFVERRAATVGLAEHFAEVDAFLKYELDALIHPLRKTHFAFYVTYRNARAVRKTPRSRKPGTEAAAGS
jgi:hypothetical protein